MDKNTTYYQLIKGLVAEMTIGEVREIAKPTNIEQFRSYLSIVSYKNQKRFTTKVVGDKILVKRIKKVDVWAK